MALIRTLCKRFAPTAVVSSRHKTTYIVLLPEVPDDTPESNSLLNPMQIPKFNDLTPEKCYSAVGKLCLDYESTIWELEEQLKDPAGKRDFPSIIDHLGHIQFALNSSWGFVKALNIVQNHRITTESYLKIHNRARQARTHTFHSLPIYEACKELYMKDNSLNVVQKRVLRKFLLESRLNGIELPKKKGEQLGAYLGKVENHKDLYRKKLHEATRRFAHRIDDAEVVKDFPEPLLKSMSLNSTNYLEGPWKVTLQSHVYHGFLRHCPNKNLRFNAWRAFIMRCSSYVDKTLANSTHVEEIRFARLSQAKLLGFDNFAHMSMETKMAGSVENVLSMITSLIAKSKPAQTKELNSLEEFAKSRGFEGTFEECDVSYWRRVQKDALYNLSSMDLENYFPLNHVLSNLFELTSSLFGLLIEEKTTDETRVWHPDVKYYKIYDNNGKEIASFFIDLYARPGEKVNAQSSMFPLRNRAVDADPVASLIFNFTKPAEGQDLYLSLDEITDIFREFGRCLQQLISTVTYGEVSGLTNIEWDAVDLCPNFMERWLYEPSILKSISKHSSTGDSLSPAMIKDIIASHLHLSAYDLCRELFLAHLDMRLHTEDIFWMEIVDSLNPQYRHFPMHKKEALCSWFSPIISDIYAAAYYSHTWSKMLALDAFEAFQECEPDEVAEVGKRFKSTFLELGGGCHTSEVFRKFRGRDPSPQALLTDLRLS